MRLFNDTIKAKSHDARDVVELNAASDREKGSTVRTKKIFSTISGVDLNGAKYLFNSMN